MSCLEMDLIVLRWIFVTQFFIAAINKGMLCTVVKRTHGSCKHKVNMCILDLSAEMVFDSEVRRSQSNPSKMMGHPSDILRGKVYEVN